MGERERESEHKKDMKVENEAAVIGSFVKRFPSVSLCVCVEEKTGLRSGSVSKTSRSHTPFNHNSESLIPLTHKSYPHVSNWNCISATFNTNSNQSVRTS